MKENLRRLLARRQKKYITDASRIPSAVLIPFFARQGEYYILFIRRTETVKTHKGQISFPGGTHEEGETLLETALREGEEEIGLKAGDAEVLGELDDFVTVTSSYIVTPFVAVIPWPYRFQASETEVAEIIEIPVAALLDKSCLRQDTESEDDNAPVYDYQGKVIWGATARILGQFLDIFSRATGDG